LLADPQAGVRTGILAEYQTHERRTLWSTVPSDRTVAELLEEAKAIQAALDVKHEQKVARQKAKHAEKAARERAARIEAMKADPEKTLRETEQLVRQRGTDNYQKVAERLAELRDALAGSDRSNLAAQQARTLREKHPTLRILVSALRKQGFLPR
jgi:hypothetical protein